MANDQQEPPESFQEIQEYGISIASGDIQRFQMLHLNSDSTADHQFTSVATTSSPSLSPSPSPSGVGARPFVRCTDCGSIKRRSPSSLQEPPAKRVALSHPDTTTNNNVDAGSDGSKNEDLGNGKFPLDAPAAVTFITPVKPVSPVTNQNVLNRSMSDNINYVGTLEKAAEKNYNGQALISQSGENSKVNSPSVGTLPPLPPPLRRSTSAPIPSDCQPLVADSTPSRAPSAARTFVPSPGFDQESAESKRLKRIKEGMKQMSQWAQKLASEEDLDEDASNTCDESPQKISEIVPETRPNQEAVWIEESGENLIVHFKCPCCRRYEIFLAGKKCYYRLL